MPISARCKQNGRETVNQELERRSTLENRNWSDRSTTPQSVYLCMYTNVLILVFTDTINVANKSE